MKLLQDTIREQGGVLSDVILDVSDFINAQVDPVLMDAIGKEFAEYYKEYDFDAFVTVEASGIAPSVFAAMHAKKPLLIIKKSQKELDTHKFAQQPCYSFTKQNHYLLAIKKDLLTGKKLILIDDFLAMGSVVENVDALLKANNAELVATGILVSKNFQDGFKNLVANGHDLHSLAQVESLNAETGEIKFVNEAE